MYVGSSIFFTADRFSCPNSALALNGGWTQVPSGIYFDSPEFTISAWIYPQKVGSFARIIDFGNGPNMDNVLFGLSWSDTVSPYVYFAGKNYIPSMSLNLYQWQFIVTTFDRNFLRIYIDGSLVKEWSLVFNVSIVKRNKCYIGKSNWAYDGYSYSYIDDLRFYNKSLAQMDIMDLMKSNQTSMIDFL